MKRKLLLTLALVTTILAMGQSKSTGVIALNNGVPITANFTLNNTTSQVTLILTGPSDRWFGLGIGIVQGFGMGAGDVLVFTTNTTPNNLTDRYFDGTVQPLQDTQDWTTVSNIVSGSTRTLTLTRALTNSDSNDFQFPYATTNSITIGGVRGSSANNMTVAPHGGSASAGFATGTFTTLGLDGQEIKDFVVYPNPTKDSFSIQTQEELSSVIVYNNVGKVVGNLKPTTGSYDISFLSTGIYFIEMQALSGKKSYEKMVKE